MKGYGYSIWIVPDNYDAIKREYKMNHIPHITIATNYETSGDARRASLKYKPIATFTFLPGYHHFPNMYEQDILEACGFYCVIHDIVTRHRPHMSIYYDNVIHDLNPPAGTLSGSIHIADTTSLKESQWHIM